MTETTRPEGITDEHLIFLDDLRNSGQTNMFGAASYVEDEFGVNAKEAKRILMYWMKSFGRDDR